MSDLCWSTSLKALLYPSRQLLHSSIGLEKTVFPSWKLCFHEDPANLLCFCKNEWVRCQTAGSSFQREFSENLFCSYCHGLFCGWLLGFLTKQGSAAAPACSVPEKTQQWEAELHPCCRHSSCLASRIFISWDETWSQNWWTWCFSSLAVITFQRNPG